MPESYSPPRKKVDINVIKTDMEAYNKLKTRIVLNSLKFGAVGAVVVYFWLGLDAASSYALGSSSAALYLFLLGKKTDQIGDSFSLVNPIDPAKVNDRQLQENLGKARFTAPLLLVLLLTLKNVVNGGEIAPFRLVPQESFLPCLLYTSPSPRDRTRSRMPSSA